MASLMPAHHNLAPARRAFAIALLTSMANGPAAIAADTSNDCVTGDTCTTAAGTNAQPATLSRKERRRLRKEQKAQRDQERNEFLDWYPLSELSPAQLAATPQHCNGAYIGPKFVASGRAYRPPRQFILEGSPETEAELARQAEQMTQSAKGTELLADNLDYDKSSEIANVSGNIAIRDKGALIRGSSATYNTVDGTGSIEDANMVSHTSHIRVHADKIARESPTFIRITNGDFTQCAPSDNTWVIRASEFRLNQENNLATARNAQLRVKDVPIFWTPWLTYPLNNQRRSGLLFPTLSTSSSTNGLDFSVPWYWNIAPNMDATIAGRHAGDRGLAVEAEFRYLNRFSEWQISGSIINDDTIDDNGETDNSGSTIENPRWYFNALERGTLPNSWQHRIDYTSVSDNEYLNDLSGATSLSFKRSTNLEQSAKTWRYGEQLDFSAEVIGYQIIDDSVSEQYSRMPQLWLDFESSYRLNRPSWLMEAQLTNFQIGDDGRPSGGRVYLEPGVSLPITKPWGYFTPTIKLKSVTYALDDGCLRPTSGSSPTDPCPPDDDGISMDAVNDQNPSTTLPMFSIDTALFFDRPTEWFGKRFTHTLEPRLYYLYTEYEDQSDQPLFDTGFNTFDYQQLFRETRFTGYDRIADANQITLGLTTRLKQSSSGVDTVWASVGQTFFFADRQVTLDTPAAASSTNDYSPIASELGYQWTRNLRSYATLIYDFNIVETVFDSPTEPAKDLENCATPTTPASCPNLTDKRKGIRQAGLQFRYFGDNGLIFNAGYRYRVNETLVSSSNSGTFLVEDYINQTDFSTNFPVTRHWSVLARHNYDFTNNRALGTVAGFEYNSCCWITRVVYQSGLSTSGDAENRIDPETESGIYFQIRLKGLGGADTGVQSILRDSIFHYEDYDKLAEF